MAVACATEGCGQPSTRVVELRISVPGLPPTVKVPICEACAEVVKSGQHREVSSIGFRREDARGEGG